MIEVVQMPVGPLETNCYLLSKGTEAVIIDPGGDEERILKRLEKRNLSLTLILNTNLHFDHIAANAPLQKAFGVPIKAHPADSYLLKTGVGRGGIMGFPLVELFDLTPLHEGSETILGSPCQVLLTPGHSPGSLSFYFPELKQIFSGDVLFRRSIGRSDFPGGDHETLIQSVQEKIFTLPGATTVWPGHGPSTTVFDEKLHNPFFNESFM